MNDALQKSTIALTKVVEHSANAASAGIKTAEQVANTATATFGTVEHAANAASSAIDAAGKVATAAGNITDESSKLAIKSLSSLGDQISNTNKITSTLMETTNESLQKSKQHIGDNVGNVAAMTSAATGTALKSLELGTFLFDSLIAVIKSPFEGVKMLNDNIKASTDDPKVKFDKIKQNIINNFNNTITPELQKNFTNQLMELIKNVDELVKLYRTLGCKVNMIWQYNCPPEIQEKINAISQIKIKMETDKEIFLREIKQIFGKFHSKTVGIYALAINKENYEKKIEEMEQKIQEIQDNIITEVTEKHTVIIKKFQDNLQLINDNIEQLSNASSSVLNVQPVQSTPVQPTAGGRKRKYKTRRNKKNKTSKSNKRKRSRKRI